MAYVSKLDKFYRLITCKKISESDFLDSHHSKSSLIIFEGIDDLFTPILFDNVYIKNSLFSMVNKKHLKGLDYNFKNTISMHIRLGDFVSTSQATPISWFIDVMNLIISKVPYPPRVLIFSDGTDAELADLFIYDNVERVTFGSSIADLIGLSRSNVLIASKGSTFSMWASYLGRMPVIWPINENLQKLYYETPLTEVESDGEELPAKFIDSIHNLFLIE